MQALSDDILISLVGWIGHLPDLGWLFFCGICCVCTKFVWMQLFCCPIDSKDWYGNICFAMIVRFMNENLSFPCHTKKNESLIRFFLQGRWWLWWRMEERLSILMSMIPKALSKGSPTKKQPMMSGNSNPNLPKRQQLQRAKISRFLCRRLVMSSGIISKKNHKKKYDWRRLVVGEVIVGLWFFWKLLYKNCLQKISTHSTL